ncbi:TPA: hypothetical protein ACGHDT_000258 [Salmonella enterica subsp. enterica serovar Reading]|nr:hypothetical protein [Salmonella enterica subsp. enterica serovar Reading]
MNPIIAVLKSVTSSIGPDGIEPNSPAIDESGVQMIRQKMTVKVGRNPKTGSDITASNLYPLAIGNLMIAAMNEAAELGVPVVNGEIIKNLNTHIR